MSEQINKIGILCFWSFPEGMAPTTRILSYSKGLLANNVQVEIISFRRIFKDEVKKDKIEKSGTVEGIKYIYPHFFKEKGKTNKLVRGIDEIILRLKIFWYILKSNLNLRFDCFLFSFDDYRSLNAYTQLLIPFRIPIGLVADEYPIPIRDFNKSEIPPEYILKYKKAHRSISFRILMTEALRDFYNEKISVKPTHVMSSVTEIKRFEGVINHKVNKKYICYMGNMGLAKDNVDNIIIAFSLIAQKFNDINLYLYGTPNDNDKSTLESLIVEKKLTDRVFIMGRIGFEYVPQVLANAYILVTSQPITKRAEGGFPTKLGEYLMSGVPSVLTNVGEIYIYIKDGVNAYMVEPCNPQQYAEKLEFIINNYDDALKVAKTGKQYIIDNFSNDNVARKLIDFLETQYNQ